VRHTCIGRILSGMFTLPEISTYSYQISKQKCLLKNDKRNTQSFNQKWLKYNEKEIVDRKAEI